MQIHLMLFLLINGMKTLEVRMERHCHNAMEVANFLEKHTAVAKVNYTGLAIIPIIILHETNAASGRNAEF